MNNADVKLENCWNDIKKSVFNNVKVCLLRDFCEDILEHYNLKIEYVVSQYSRHIPFHVASTEKDDFLNIAKLEFLETFKVWDMDMYPDIWPLAYRRIRGAMRDYIRYITKANPSKFYDWVSEASYMYMEINESNAFEKKVETGMQLNYLMTHLSKRDRQIVLAYTKEDLTFSQIGKRWDLSESQISRIYKKALKVIRAAIDSEESQQL